MKSRIIYIAIFPLALFIAAISCSVNGGKDSSSETVLVLEGKRKVKQVISSRVSKAGPMDMKQPLPHRNLDYLDPFLLLHHHGPNTLGPSNAGLPFGPHPHKGFETVTFIYSGDVKHRDSNGYESIIETGGIQYMTAAGGIVHSERSSEKFKKEGGTLEMIQIWINLPNKLKNEKSNYIGLQSGSLPMIDLPKNKLKIQVVSGEWEFGKGAVNGLYPVNLANLFFQPQGQIDVNIPTSHNVMLYVLEGEFEINDVKANGHQLVVFENSGTQLSIRAISQGKILLGHGQPIGEPMVSYGPFVMTTEEEVMEAIEAYQEGKMGYLAE